MQEIALYTWYVILVILGVNALIIVHEFGHFIVARMCGVRCDKFYIWFDIYGLRFFRFKWGDTEYGLGVLPLGGYVKMFGQEDNPGQIAKEIEKAKERGQTADGSRQEGAAEGEAIPTKDELKYMESALYAKDSYLSKSVPQRMAIISAGVIMNLIFAVICATAAFMVGFTENPCAVGALVPGSPAWTAGLQIGDRIVEADGKKLTAFPQIMDALVDGDSSGVRMTIDRPGVKEPLEKVIPATQVEGALVPTIGIRPMGTTNLSKVSPLSSALKKELPDEVVSSLKSGNRLVAIGDQPIENYADIIRLQETSPEKTLSYKFQKGNDADKTITVEVPAVPVKELGVRFRMGAISAVRKGSAAESAGIEPGDTLVEVDDLGPLDPLKLPYLLAQKAIAEPNAPISIGIRKKGSETVEKIELPLVVSHENMFAGSPGDAVACSSIGIAYNVDNIVAGSDSDVQSSIPVGAVVQSVDFPDFAPEFGVTKTSFLKVYKKWIFWTKGFCFLDVGKKVQIPFIFEDAMQVAPVGTIVRLHTTFEGKKEVYDFTVRKSTDWFDPNRGFHFAPEEFLSKAESFGQAAQLGFDKTVYGTLAVYRFLSNIGGKVSAKAMGGPVTIVKVAYMVASQGLGPYLIFLCIIGANLAVLNILPIPVLDGGHLVFLAYEAIFRKPPNEGIQIGLSYIGLLLLLGMMAWAISLDLGFISRF